MQLDIKKIINLLSYSFLSSDFIFEILGKESIVVFNYHEVSENPSQFSIDNDLNVTPDLFREHIRWIKKRFEIMSPKTLLEIRDINKRYAMITFDDGFSSTFKNALPILQREEVPSLVFINMAPIEGELFWSGLVCYLCKYNDDFRYFIQKRYNIREREFLKVTENDLSIYFSAIDKKMPNDEIRQYYEEFATTDDLKTSAEYGAFLGNHLYNHFNAVNISNAELENQYKINHQKLLKYENYIELFSYPFGQPGSCFNSDTDKVIITLGARRIFTAYPGINHDISLYRMNRFSPNAQIKNEKDLRFYIVKHVLLTILHKMLHCKKYPRRK